MTRTTEVAIVVMPFYGVERPALGPSQLAAELQARGRACQIIYANIDFVGRVGLEPYERIISNGPTGLPGEWVFAEALWGPRPVEDQQYLADIAEPDLSHLEADLPGLRVQANDLIDAMATEIDWSSYSVVGFSSMFDQQLASLALARRIAADHPEVTIVFGGANCEGEMGEVLHQKFDFVDIVCRGAADKSFPEVVEALAGHGDLSGIDGVCYRDRDGRSVSNPDTALLADLDDLIYPHFDEYFEAFETIDHAAADLQPHLQIETARGCWWGDRSHCTFCGLNGQTMAFRSKSPERVLHELRHQSARHGVSRYQVADAILDMRYFSSLLPDITAEPEAYSFWWEVKANLSHRQVRALARAGVARIQPGIESLSDSVLELMGKGSKAVHNIQLLRWCRELGVAVDWNFLYGFPGERPEDYAAMAALVPHLVHLEPPAVLTAIRIDRFSPYHTDPEGHGLVDLEPFPAYRHIYPFEDADLDRLAYFFAHAYADGRNPTDHVMELAEAVTGWWQAEGSSFTVAPSGDDEVVLSDRRRGHTPRDIRLRGWKARVYLAMDRATSLAELTELLDEGTDPTQLQTFLAFCEQHGYAARPGDEYVALATHHPPRWDTEAPRRRVHIPVLAG